MSRRHRDNRPGTRPRGNKGIGATNTQLAAHMTGTVPDLQHIGIQAPAQAGAAGAGLAGAFGTAQALLRGQAEVLDAILRREPLERSLARIVNWMAGFAGAVRALVVVLADGRPVPQHVHAVGLPDSAVPGMAAQAATLLAAMRPDRDDVAAGPGADGAVDGKPISMRTATGLPPAWRNACIDANVDHCTLAPLRDTGGQPCGVLMMALDDAKDGTGTVKETGTPLLMELGACAGRLAELAIRQHKAEQALARANERLDLELADTRLLQGMSVKRIDADDTPSLFAEIVAAAVEIMDSDCASIQMLYRDRGPHPELRLLSSHGFDAAASAFWEWVRFDSASTCGMALRDGVRIHVADIEDCDGAVSGDDLQMYRHLGIRAVQTTPLLARNGEVLGMISTHWRRPHHASERDFRLFDILVRQAADIVQHSATQRALARDAHQKDIFLAQLAHELRNPLAPLRTVSELLLREPDDPAVSRYAGDVVARQVGHFSRLVDDLLDVSRITRGQIELRTERTTLQAVLSLAIEMTEPTRQERRQTLQVSLPEADIVLQADVVRLSQVFANLLINASKYSGAASQIGLDADVSPGESGGPPTARVTVRDAGIGIAHENRERVFDLFFQVVASPQGTQSGLGVGLALVRRLVELHQGTVTVCSDGPGKGAEFVVQLPCVASPAHATDTARARALSRAPAMAGGEAAPMRPLRVLVADDNVDAAESLGEVLRMVGHEPHLAADGHEAIALADSLQPDVLLLDIGMPGLDGYNVCEYVRRRPWAANARLIAISGHGTAADKQRSAAAGFAMHLTKPADIAALLGHLGDIAKAR